MPSLPSKTATRAAIYVRVSSRQQEEGGTSLDTQEEACRAYAAERGWVLEPEHVYREVHTGVELWERVHLTRLRQAIREKAIDVVVAYSIDRLSRDPVHLGVVLTEAQPRGVAVEFVLEPLDGSPEGDLIRYVRGYAAKIDHEKRREATLRGRHAAARAGKLQHGPRPRYGYRWRDQAKSAYDADPVTAPVVRRLFADALAGATLRSMALALQDEGVPTPAGGRVWDYGTISRILRDPVYAGDAVAWRTRRVKVAGMRWGKFEERADEERIALPSGTAPPLVDRGTFAAVQQQLERNRRESTRRAADPEAYLLRAGYVKCGHCGGTMGVHRTRQGKLSNYVCTSWKREPGRCGHHGISTRLLDEVVWAHLGATINDPAWIRAERERRMAAGDPATAADLAAVDGQLAEVARDRRRQMTLLERLADLDDETLAPIKARLRQLADRKRDLDAERAAVLGRRSRWEADQARWADLEALCERTRQRTGAWDYAGKRLALAAFAVCVTVWRTGGPRRFKIYADPAPIDGSELRTSRRTPHTTTPPPLLSWTEADPVPAAV